MSEFKSYMNSVAEAILSTAESQQEDIEKAIVSITDALKKGNKVLIFGNGGSAADAQHFAAEFMVRFKLKRKGLPVIALTTDTSIITAAGNDFGYGCVFSRQVDTLACKDDVVIGISTSGTSSSVINGMQAAMDIGATMIVLTGKRGELFWNKHCITLTSQSEDTAHIQECHIAMLHFICEQVERRLANET